jgi:RNA polymerase sigma factor (TIGR02999 family)
MPDVTRLLDAAAAGDRKAAADLLPLVYDELWKLAAARMASEAPGHTLDATALVHEAYLRLVGGQQFDGRGHFFAAAEAMRRILVTHARDRNRLKRSGRVRVELLDQAGCRSRIGSTCSGRSARRCSTPTRRRSSTATSSRPTSWSPSTTASRCRR